MSESMDESSLLSAASALNEMTTASHSALMEAYQLPLGCYPPTDSDDESFVVLENGSEEQSPTKAENTAPLLASSVIDESLELATEALLRSLTPQPLPDMPPFDGISGSVCSSVSVDELQQRIETLIEENQKLSDSLVQNNIVMKTQYETLSKWQEDVERVHESHKKKFAETKEYIRKLQEENKKLKQMCVALQAFAEESENEIIPPKVSVEDVSTSMDSLKQAEAQQSADFNVLKQALKDAQDELALARQKNARQEAEMDTIVAKMGTLSTVSSLQSVEIFNMKSELTNAQSNSNSLETAAKDLHKDLQAKTGLVQKLQVDIAQISEERVKLEVDNARMAKQVLELRTQLEKTELLEEHLKRQVLASSSERQEMKTQLDDMHRKEQKLLEDVTSLKCQLAKMKNSDTGELQHLRIQLNAAQSMITDLKEKEKAIKQEAKCNQDAVDALNEQLKAANIQADAVAALNEQVALYRANCDAERSLKIKAVEELNRISNDLQMVQKRNFELTDETAALREQLREETAAAPAAEARDEGSFQCPRCLFEFWNYRALENHVHRCIDLDMLP